MKSILEELYFANEGLVDKIIESEKFNKINHEYEKLFERLMEGRDDEQKKMLNELYLLTGGPESEAGLVHFKAGFRFCMRLVFDGIDG